MVIYQVQVTKGGEQIFSHDIVMEEGRSFSADVHNALETFRQNFPQVSLMDDGVDLNVARKPE